MTGPCVPLWLTEGPGGKWIVTVGLKAFVHSRCVAGLHKSGVLCQKDIFLPKDLLSNNYQVPSNESSQAERLL